MDTKSKMFKKCRADFRKLSAEAFRKAEGTEWQPYVEMGLLNGTPYVQITFHKWSEEEIKATKTASASYYDDAYAEEKLDAVWKMIEGLNT